MKLKPQHIHTFCRWLEMASREKTTHETFFWYAMNWKFGKVDKQRLLFICVAFNRSRYIPDFAEEYWNKRVLPMLVVGGSK